VTTTARLRNLLVFIDFLLLRLWVTR